MLVISGCCCQRRKSGWSWNVGSEREGETGVPSCICFSLSHLTVLLSDPHFEIMDTLRLERKHDSLDGNVLNERHSSAEIVHILHFVVIEESPALVH